MTYLKQSTAVTVLIGPFIDDTDGKSAETGLTLAQADIRLSKNAGNMAQKTEATGCTHDELGYYTCPLDGTDTATLGQLKLMVHQAGSLPVWHDFLVVTANVYDTLCSTDLLQTDLTQIGGVAQSATDLKDFADTGYDPATHNTQANMAAVSLDTTAADNLETMLDGTGGKKLTLEQLVVNSSSAGGAIDIDNSNGVAIWATSTGLNSVVFEAQGAGAGGAALRLLAGANGYGLYALGGSSSGAGMYLASTGGWAIQCAGTSGDIDADITGNITGNLVGTVSTVTTNTDMRGTDSAALAATALSTATWTAARAGYLDELAAANIPADLDLVLADTNELQTNQGNWLTATGFSTHTAAAAADAVWDELVTGHDGVGKAGAQLWTDVDAILADTGTDGVVVAAASKTGYSLSDGSITAATIANAAIDNATFAADVGSTAYATNIVALASRKALDEINLDHLAKVAVANNADMTAEVVDGSILSNVISATSDTSTFVEATDSLEALAGSSAPSAATIADAVWDEVQTGHVIAGTFGKYLDAQVSSVGGAAGAGAVTDTFTVEDAATDPIQGAEVWISDDAAGANVLYGTLNTNTLGVVTFNIDVVNGLYVHVHKTGYNFTDYPKQFNVAAGGFAWA